MKFTPQRIPDVVLIEPTAHGDDRGFFMETWHAGRFAEAGIPAAFVQDNHSRSVRNTLRGLHYQLRQPQGKLLRVIGGEVFDVAVDLRRGSRTFGQWVGITLSAANRRLLWVPAGFAHGFYVQSDVADFVYKVTDYHDPVSERSIIWNDPDVAIAWPIAPGIEPLLSAKDGAATSLRAADCYP